MFPRRSFYARTLQAYLNLLYFLTVVSPSYPIIQKKLFVLSFSELVKLDKKLKIIGAL